jgi:hypothetical protein
MAYVFQYGSNMSATRLNDSARLNGDARAISAVYTVEKFELTFDVWSRTNNCAAGDLIPLQGRKIWGVLYDIPTHLIARETSGGRKSLDAIEGRRYQRVSISLRYPDGNPVRDSVVTYVVLASERQPDIRTSLDYCRHIIDGLRDYSDVVPAEYLEYVKSRMIANNPELTNDVHEL